MAAALFFFRSGVIFYPSPHSPPLRTNKNRLIIFFQQTRIIYRVRALDDVLLLPKVHVLAVAEDLVDSLPVEDGDAGSERLDFVHQRGCTWS